MAREIKNIELILNQKTIADIIKDLQKNQPASSELKTIAVVNAQSINA